MTWGVRKINVESVFRFTWLPFPVSVGQVGDEDTIINDFLPIAIDTKVTVHENGNNFYQMVGEMNVECRMRREICMDYVAER